MSKSELSQTRAAFLARVRERLSDVPSEDRRSLLEDLEAQLYQMPEEDLFAQLGTPETVARDYRESLGMASGGAITPRTLRTATSILLLPLGVLVLFSFGGQLVIGLPVLALEWLVARMAPRGLRLIWSALAGLLAGEAVYLYLGEVTLIAGLTPVRIAAGLATGLAVTWLYATTTRS